MCSLLTDVQLFHRGKKSVTERHKVTLPPLMLRNYYEKEILVKDQFPLFQLSTTEFSFGKHTLPKSYSAFKQGQEVDCLACVLWKGVWAAPWGSEEIHS